MSTPISTGHLGMIQIKAGMPELEYKLYNRFYPLPAEDPESSSSMLMNVVYEVLENDDADIVYALTNKDLGTETFNRLLTNLPEVQKSRIDVIQLVPYMNMQEQFMTTAYLPPLRDLLNKNYRGKRVVVIIDDSHFFDERQKNRPSYDLDIKNMESIVKQYNIPVVTATPNDVFLDYLTELQQSTAVSDEEMARKEVEEVFNMPRTDHAAEIMSHPNQVCVAKVEDYDAGRDALIDVTRELLQYTDKTILYYSLTVVPEEFFIRLAASASQAFAEVIPGAPALTLDQCVELADTLEKEGGTDEELFFRNAVLYCGYITRDENGKDRVKHMLHPVSEDDFLVTIDDMIISVLDYITENPDDDIAVVIDYPLFHAIAEGLEWITIGAEERLQKVLETSIHAPIIISKSV